MKRVALLALLLAAPLHAQSAGKTGAQVLQLTAGARAAALSGAYSAVAGDADALFHNPAGIAAARIGVSASYETHATGIAFGSAAGFTQLGPVFVGASVAYLDEGSIDEITPDASFGGNVGTATGTKLSAAETAARVSVALPLSGGRLRVGASFGYVSSSVAELRQGAPVIDAGLQYDVAGITTSATLRNAGGPLSGGGDPLPTEARVGAAVPLRRNGRFTAQAFGDAIARLHEGTFDAAAGIEAGVLPLREGMLGAVARVGVDAEAEQLGRLRFGAGITLSRISFDYAYQNYRVIGAVHRVGLRWSTR